MTRRVLVLVYPGCQALDVAGPVDTLLLANEVCADRGMADAPYSVELVAPRHGDVATHGGALRLNVERSIDDLDDEELSGIDTFLIAGGFSAPAVRARPEVIAFVKRASDRAQRLASICTAAFLFAEAGVLESRRVTTHWRVAKLLADSYPQVDVRAEEMICRDGSIWSSGGISAGVDLALAIVEDDLGSEVARSVARMMVMFLARPGDQAQFESPVPDAENAPPNADMKIQEVINLIRLEPARDLRLSALASRFGLTGRTLSRRFTAFTGMTPGRFVEESRIAHARLQLEDSDDELEQVAAHAGFGSADSLRRAFLKRFSISPADYRARFQRAFRGSATPMS